MDGENGKEGVSQDGGEGDTMNFEDGNNPDTDGPEEVKGDTKTPQGADAVPEDRSNGAEGTHGIQDNTEGCLAPTGLGTNQGERSETPVDEEEEAAIKNSPQTCQTQVEQAAESKTIREVEGSNEDASSITPEHAEAVVKPLSNLSMKTNVMNVGPPKDKSMPESSTASVFAVEVEEQEKMDQGTHDVSVTSHPESAGDDTAVSDISKINTKLDGLLELEDWEIVPDESNTKEHVQDDNMSGEEPIKDEGQNNQDDSPASKREQNEMSDNSLVKEVLTKDPQTNDVPGQFPSSGNDVSTKNTATGEPKPGTEPDEGTEGHPAEGNRVEEDSDEEKQAVKKNDAVKDNEQSGSKEEEKRPVSISLCTSAYSFNVKGLESYLQDMKKKHPELIKEVKIHQLPYNDLDHYRFPVEEPIDVMILCHSINNRRFAITDVMDALYDEYLPYCESVVGKAKMGVIVHDFDDMKKTAQLSRMSSFKNKQPKAFKTTNLQVTCGHIEKKEQVSAKMFEEDQLDKLKEFLENASKHPEQMMDLFPESEETLIEKAKRMKQEATHGNIPSWNKPRTSDKEVDAQPPTKRRKHPANQTSNSNVDTGVHEPDETTKGSGLQTRYAQGNPSQQQVSGTSLAASTAHTPGSPCQQSMSQSPGNVDTSTTQSSLYMTQSHPRPISVSICSSAYQHNVKGLVSWFTTLKTKQPHMIEDVRFRELPYNDIDSFKFPQADPVDVMVLCHSVQNRGFSITNVLNSIYDKYLKYCHDAIGKHKLAVIVHDFTDLKPETTEVKMESFRRLQPSTFKLVDTVIIYGSLEVPDKIEMRDKEEGQLLLFLEKARFELKENLPVNYQSYTDKLKGFVYNS